MAGAHVTWKGGSLGKDEGRWGSGADWSGGQAPSPGDLVTIDGVKAAAGHIGEVITWQADETHTLIDLFPKLSLGEGMHPQQIRGDDIGHETIDLNGNAGIPELWLQATTLTDDVVNVAGTVVLESYLSNDFAGGFLTIGDGAGSGVLQLQLYGEDTAGYAIPNVVATDTLSGHTTAKDGSALRIISVTGNGLPAVNLANTGVLSLAAGATLFVDDTDGSGVTFGTANSTEIVNAGTILIEGGAGATTTASITANLVGAGTLDMRGNGATRGATTLTVSGNVTDQHILADDATIRVNDASAVIGDPSQQGFAVTGGSFTFGPDGATLTLHQPPLTTLQFVDGGTKLEQLPDGQHPFTTPIDGFGAGDTIELVGGDTGGRYFTTWDAAKHLLSVDFAVSVAGNPPGILGQYTLEGSYQASGFHLSGNPNTETLSLTYGGAHG